MEEIEKSLNIMESTHQHFNSYELGNDEKCTKSPKLYLKNLDKEMTENGVMNYCSQFGRVRSVSLKSNFCFVNYLTLR